jgi:hypothetical protein
VNWLTSISPEHVLSFLAFTARLIAITAVSWKYAGIFQRAAEKDPATVKEAGITFVSGHFLAFFLLPFALLVSA